MAEKMESVERLGTAIVKIGQIETPELELSSISSSYVNTDEGTTPFSQAWNQIERSVSSHFSCPYTVKNAIYTKQGIDSVWLSSFLKHNGVFTSIKITYYTSGNLKITSSYQINCDEPLQTFLNIGINDQVSSREVADRVEELYRMHRR